MYSGKGYINGRQISCKTYAKRCKDGKGKKKA